MPYYRCAECDLTVQLGAGHSTRHVCPECGAGLALATRVLVRDVVQPDLHLDMVREPQAAAAASRELEALLGELDRAELDVTALLTTELINSSVEHAGPRAGGRLALDVTLTNAAVRVAVTDGGHGFVAGPGALERQTDGHHGLQLVDALADRWGNDSDGRTVVWFEVDRNGRSRTNGSAVMSRPSRNGSASSNGARPASDADIGWRWVAAINRRDADGLVEMADDMIELHPTRLDGGGHVYHGHEGIRRWIADLSDSAYAFVEHATDVRRVASGRIGVFGHVLSGERRIGPFSMLLSMRDGKIAETHAYLSHEAELRRIGHLPG